MEMKVIIKQIEKHQNEIAVKRDALDNFIDELTGLRESCQEAWENLEAARDHLSEFV